MRHEIRDALAQTLYESMNDYLRLWGDLEDERRKTWLIHADALLPVVERYARRKAAEELRSAAKDCGYCWRALEERADELDPT